MCSARAVLAASALLGVAIHVLTAGLLVAGATLLVAGVGAIFLLIVGFEFALLSSKPLLTELGWQRQGLGVGIGFATSAACRSLAALAGTPAAGGASEQAPR